MSEINRHMADIKKLCIQHHVKSLYLFGSAAAGRQHKESDVDLLVEFNTMDLAVYAANYYELKNVLEQLLRQPVDLLEKQALKNPYLKKEIESKKQPVYVA